MKKNISVCFLILISHLAKPQINFIGEIEKLSPDLDKYVGQSSKIEILAKGFEWSEGPVWVDKINSVLFSDVPENKIYKWNENEGLSVYIEPSGYSGKVPTSKKDGSNGLILNSKNELLVCMHGDREIAKLTKWGSGEFETVINKFQGKLFNSPNDMVFTKNGDLIFTDPPYGLKNRNSDKLKELKINGVYKLTTDGEVTLLVDNLTYPNGVALSNDDKIMYVNVSDSSNPRIMAYDIDKETINNERIFFDGRKLAEKNVGLFDGIKIHPDGTIFSTGPGGVLIINKDGTHLGTIKTVERTANCAFDSAYEYLYMTTDMFLTRVKLKTN
ncbi:MAG: SMP-30/gluconolactonase/LRE family protein [Flavobacteriaceae bacterium TMED206]|nr:MAG: SMP-30/gluconolactonase/LRE family protein [Flavobacteriaceae bacterium TMED206]|tara:strand:- start:1256 stop:2242 length:987 start_codon:yes stop_codon:yes gene_type:complete